MKTITSKNKKVKQTKVSTTIIHGSLYYIDIIAIKINSICNKPDLISHTD